MSDYVDYITIGGVKKWVRDAVSVKQTAEAVDAANKALSAAGTAASSANTAAKKAEDAAGEANREAASARNAAASAKKAKEDADIATESANSKAEAAESAAASAGSATASATTAAEKAETAAQQATAAANKVFPAADNVLAGEASGTVAHAEDAFEGAALRGIAVEGACRQDGIPSPENPVPIEVVENPVVKVVGRNVLDIAALAKESPEYYKADGDTLTILKTDNRAWTTFAATQELKAGTYILVGDFIDLKDVDGNSLSFSVGMSGAPFTLPVDTKVKIKIGYGRTLESYPYTSKAMIERSSSASDYAPYSPQARAFALPAEHPYLAKLPDGTADTIEVDEAGNVELVARVSKAIIDASKSFDWGKGKVLYGFPKDGRYPPQGGASGSSAVCEKFEAKDGYSIYKGTDVGISVGSSAAHTENCTTVFFLGDGADLSSIDGASFYYPLMTPVRYKLAPIEMPKAQDSIVNAWTDAEVTPSTSIRYIRDVNIVVANIESAIASITQG